MFDFWIDGQSGAARSGSLRLPHGIVETPVFMPVGTQATVRTLSPADLKAVGAQIVLAGTTSTSVRRGRHRKTRRTRSSATGAPAADRPGGFQVFSLRFRKVDEDGVESESRRWGRRKPTPRHRNQATLARYRDGVRSRHSRRG
jgi:queuine tRNA-ribosyltransferase